MTDRQKSLYKWISFLLFLALTFLIVHRVYRVLSWKDTLGTYQSSAEQFYQTEEGLVDVAFFGSSHVYAGLHPEFIWREYGYSAFNFAVSGQDKWSTIHYMRELLKTQTPRVMIVDMFAAEFERHGNQGNLYRNMLSLRPSRNAFDLVHRYIAEEERMDYYLRWPIIHTRYRELTMNDFVLLPFNSYGRGAASNFRAEPVDFSWDFAHITEAEPLSESNREFIDQLAEIQQSHDLAVIPVMLPCAISEEDQKIINGVMQYATECGLTCIDFNKMREELGLVPDQDYSDGGHLNSYGAEKVSLWIGKYLQEHFEPEDHRGDPAYWQWDASSRYEEHCNLKEQLKTTSGLQPYANVLAQAEGLTVVLVLPEGFGEQKNRLSKAAELLHLPEDFAENGGICVIDDGEVKINIAANETGATSYDADAYHTIWAESAVETEKVLHTGEVKSNAVWHVGMNREMWFHTGNMEGLGIVIYDREMGEVLEQRIFEYASLYIF